MARFIAGVLLLFSAAACGGSPPAHWARGGSRLDIPAARWARPSGDAELGANGTLRIGGEPWFRIDPEGRVRDAEGEAFALLEPDGRLVGRDDEVIGKVNDRMAIRASSGDTVIMLARGDLLRRDGESERRAGAWEGDCTRSAGAREACVLAAFLVTVETARREEQILQRELRRGRTHK